MMKTIGVLLLVAVAFTQAANHGRSRSIVGLQTIRFPYEGIDISNWADPRIVGGAEVDPPHKYPWQVELLIDGGSLCGGSLIHPQWVLTAAHCVENHRNFRIVLGAHDRSLSSEPGRQEFTTTSAEAHFHENWNRSSAANDIALIRLPIPAELTSTVNIVGLDRANAGLDNHVNEIATVSGWGKPRDGVFVNPAPILREVDVPVTTNAICQITYGAVIQEKILCIDTTGGKGSCNGDSGGPLFQLDSSTPGITARQIGVVSFGSNDGCERGYPAGFTRVDKYRDWIARITADAVPETD